YTVADLSRLWLQLEAYESDLPWLAVGQAVKFTTESYPGESFSGTVRFIDPVVDPAKRTVRVRVEVPNANSRLKPDMFARSTVDASPAGIDKSKAPLVIPASAPLITGKRAVVYVEVAGKENVYEGREVVLGPRTGDYYIVRDGLAEGEMVVVNGNFKIDSALQILAKPSMMSPAGGAPAPGHGHAGQQAADPGNSAVEHSAASHQTEPAGQAPLMFREQLTDLYHVYFAMQESLSRDVFNDFSSMVAAFTNALGNVDMTALAGDAHKRWMDSLNRLKEMAAGLAAAGDIEEARSQFAPLSEILIDVFKSYGAAGPGSVVFFHCPMAFNNQGASWLQAGGKAANPYLGSKMVGCHDIVDTLYVGQVEMGGGAHE
ncbi:MAG TPA: efflux RND transporter periplasmic adaptor subunit, partial [Candidatus Glassbacteria bacterium]|nr:efflux RND transporter periplasmic adaptor subunit [Candidatus Glassbacteria bacterium]